MHGYLSMNIMCSKMQKNVRREKLEENRELQRTDNVQGQIYEHIFAPNIG